MDDALLVETDLTRADEAIFSDYVNQGKVFAVSVNLDAQLANNTAMTANGGTTRQNFVKGMAAAAGTLAAPPALAQISPAAQRKVFWEGVVHLEGAAYLELVNMVLKSPDVIEILRNPQSPAKKRYQEYLETLFNNPDVHEILKDNESSIANIRQALSDRSKMITAVAMESNEEEMQENLKEIGNLYKHSKNILQAVGMEDVDRRTEQLVLLLGGPVFYLVATGDPVMSSRRIIGADSKELMDQSYPLQQRNREIVRLLGRMREEGRIPANAVSAFEKFFREEIPTMEISKEMEGDVFNAKEVNDLKDKDAIRLAQEAVRHQLSLNKISRERDKYITGKIRSLPIQGNLLLVLGSSHGQRLEKLFKEVPGLQFEKSSGKKEKDGSMLARLGSGFKAEYEGREVHVRGVPPEFEKIKNYIAALRIPHLGAEEAAVVPTVKKIYMPMVRLDVNASMAQGRLVLGQKDLSGELGRTVVELRQAAREGLFELKEIVREEDIQDFAEDLHLDPNDALNTLTQTSRIVFVSEWVGPNVEDFIVAHHGDAQLLYTVGLKMGKILRSLHDHDLIAGDPSLTQFVVRGDQAEEVLRVDLINIFSAQQIGVENKDIEFTTLTNAVLLSRFPSSLRGFGEGYAGENSGDGNDEALVATVSQPQKTKNSYGGINFNPQEMDIETEGTGLQKLPLANMPQDLNNLPINGFSPVIIEVVPVTSLSSLLGRNTSPQSPFELSFR